MYFKRDIEKFLLNWKNNTMKSVLEVRGARQVGKTTTLLHFAEENYRNVVYIDLTSILGKKFIELVEEESNMVKLLERYCQLCEIEFINDNSTLVLIDEVQESEMVYRLIRPLNRMTDCDVVITGSYLGKAKNYFQPVGDLEYVTMNTMSFSEFLDCYQAREFYENIDLSCENKEKFEWFSQAYDIYCRIGGYPAAIQAYLNHEDPKKAIELVFNTLMAELRSSASNILEYERIPLLLRSIIELSVKEKKGIKLLNEYLAMEFNKFNSFSISKSETYTCIAWMQECDLIGYCNKFNLTDFSEVDNARFYIKDLGILNYIAERYDIDGANLAGIRNETFVYRSLILGGFSKRFKGDRPSFGVYQDCEYDFIVKSRYDEQRYVVEVKTGKGSNSNMKQLLEQGKVRFCINYKGKTGGGRMENTLTLPIWLAERFQYNLGSKKEPEVLQELKHFQ